MQAPASYKVQYWTDNTWNDAAAQVVNPATPVGGRVNTVKFTKVTTQKVRVVFTHKGKSRSGVTEIEVWKE